jgi:dihydropteroate synthase
VASDQLILDPGLGFAKTPEHTWRLAAHLPDLIALGYPVLVGSSRKSHLGRLLSRDGTARPTDEREAATIATTVLSVAAGAWGVRVHEVRGNVDAIRVWQAVEASR